MATVDRNSKERWRMLRRIDRLIEKPMIALAFVWLVLMVVDLTIGLAALWERVSVTIWYIFLVEFAIKLLLAPNKWRFIIKNWLTALALVLPALRILRPLRFLRVLRGTQVVRVVGSLNRSMGALKRTMGRRGVGYVAILTMLIGFGGAAGMYAFEKSAGSGFSSYGESLWWTLMILTTSGSGSWPETIEGRVLAFLLALYAFSVFGYLAATLASFFVERDAAAPEAEMIGKEEYEAIMAELRKIREQQERGSPARLL